jgi:hypothetical protein
MPPDLGLFNELAVAIARSAQKMPKLQVLSFQIKKNSPSDAKPCGFNFIAGQADRPPRADWAFRSTRQMLRGWISPDEASRLWKIKCGDALEESIITHGLNLQSGEEFFRRQFDDGRIVLRGNLFEYYERDEFYMIHVDSLDVD